MPVISAQLEFAGNCHFSQVAESAIETIYGCSARLISLSSHKRSRRSAYFSANGKMTFQSVFMLMTVQPFDLASLYNACVNVPTLVAGSPWAGP